MGHRRAGWAAVGAYAALLAAVAVPAALDDDPRPAATTAADRFTTAWERSRRATFVRTGQYRRHSEVTGQEIASEDVLAQDPPRRLHRQLGGVQGRDDDRILLCPATAAGGTGDCRFGPPGGPTYDRSVAQEVAGLADAVGGEDPLYRVRVEGAGCYRLDLTRADPRAPFGIDATFCFDEATGAPTTSTVRHASGIVERVVVDDLRPEVTAADLEP